jgi:uncharacterized protein DUF4282/uncharacterized protein DUF2510
MKKKGFFPSLFDLSFKSFVTPSVIKVLYILALVIIGLGTLIGIIAGLIALTQEPASGLITLILVPLFGLLYLIYARVLLEVLIVLFQIGENTATLVKQGGGSPSSAGMQIVQPGAASPAAPAPAAPPSPPAGRPPPAAGPATPAGGAQAGGGQQAGWYPDPKGEARLRYWDGSAWTNETRN